MSPTDDLVPVLKKLRLSGVLQSLDIRLQQALDGELSHTEFLLRMLTDEVERREGKQLQLRVARANFEHHKALEDFDFHFNPQMPKAKILDLCTCTFLSTHTNVLLVGPSGVGKSHVAQAIGQRACMSGYRAMFTTAHRMLASLRAARADRTWERQLLKFTTPDLRIVDDVGLLPMQADEQTDLYEVIRQRYERGSMIITSNRDVAEWYPMFGDPLLASAAMDRLLHHSRVLILEGKSYRTARAA